MLFDEWEIVAEEEPQTFRDRTTFDGQDGDDEQIRDRELEFLSDHEIVMAATASPGTSGHETEHPGPERPPAGTSGWHVEQDRKEQDDDAGDRKTRGSAAAGKAD